jgi:enoyl-CoA hydratase/carnithine racemase
MTVITMTSEMQFVRVGRPADEIAVAVLTRPEVMNALNATMVAELRALLSSLANDRARVLIITGEGERAFSAGADLQDMLAMSEQAAYDSLQSGIALTREIEQCPKTIIAAVNGAALGGGMELALACDMRTAKADAKMGLPEVKVGIFPGWGGTVRLPRLIPGGIAREMLLTGSLVDGTRAAELGLVNRAGEDAMALAMQLADNVLRGAPVAQQQAKLVASRAGDMSIDDAMTLENQAWMRTFFSEDRREGHRAFLERRNPVWTSR